MIEALHTREEDEDAAAEIDNLIPRPAGTPGKDWGLQIEMGLSGSPNKEAKYAGLLVSCPQINNLKLALQSHFLITARIARSCP